MSSDTSPSSRPSATEPAPPSYGRIRGLDGLRGLAAVAVVLHHCTEASVPALVDVENGVGPRPEMWSWLWWAAYSPLHLVLFGPEPVYIFFVLSGLVLVLPLLDRRSVDWPGFRLAPLVRQYVPAGASLVLAAVLFLLVPRTSLPGRSTWLNGAGQSPPMSQYGVDATLLSGGVNGPLWSLRYQVLFSLLVPVYVLLFVKVRGRTAVKLALIVGAVLFGVAGGPLHPAVYRTSQFMAMFAVGVMMAAERGRLTAWVQRRSRGQTVALVALALVALGALTWRLPRISPPLEVVSLAGAALLVTVFLGSRHVTALAEHPAVQWAGRRSFSLYVVHLPVVVAVSELFVRPRPGVLHLVVVPLALLTAEVFYRLVEKPSQHLGRNLGRNWRTLVRVRRPVARAADL